MKRIVVSLLLLVVLMSFQTNPNKQAPAKNKPALAAAPAGMKTSMERGKNVYLLQCLACHQPDGGGVPHLNAPLDGTKAVVANDKVKLIRVVLKGMKGQEIDGEDYSNTMAPHPDLTDQQIADVLTYIRNTWSNKASVVTPAEVKAVRAKTK